MTKIKQFFTAVFVVSMLVPVAALGATIKTGEDVFLKKGSEVRDNLYLAGNNVSVSSAVLGDLYIAGANVLISEDISEDVTIVGGSVRVLGNIGGDLRIVGADVLVAGDIAGELIVTGGSIIISSDASIKKDLVIAGGQVSFDGSVGTDARINGETVVINGFVGGNVKADIGNYLIIGDGALIGGDIEYSASNKGVLTISDSAKLNGSVIFEESRLVASESVMAFMFGVFGALVLFKLLSFIILGLVLVWAFGNFSQKIVADAVQKPIEMLAKGFAILVLAPVASIILLATLFGAPIAFLIILLYALLLILSCVYSGIVFGVWIARKINKAEYIKISWMNVVWGMFLITVIRFIPFVGWVIAFTLFLISLGAITNIIYKKIWKQN